MAKERHTVSRRRRLGCAGCMVCNFNVGITRGQSVLPFQLAKTLNLHFRFCGESQACRCRLLKILKSHRALPLSILYSSAFVSVYWSLDVATSFLSVFCLFDLSVFEIRHLQIYHLRLTQSLVVAHYTGGNKTIMTQIKIVRILIQSCIS